MLKRLGFVLLAAFATCFPLAVGTAMGLRAPLWYALLYAMLAATVYAAIPAALGVVVVVAARSRQGGGLRPALALTVSAALLLTFALMRAGF